MTYDNKQKQYIEHSHRSGNGALLIERLIEAARDQTPVSGLTHNFYRYPARFSPKFVRAAIEAFSEPSDLIFDPFMGGGTTLVEALSLGRDALGTDISSLAAFVSEVKTTLYSEPELERLHRWVGRVGPCVNMHGAVKDFASYAEKGYHRHLGNTSTWRFRKAIAQALGSALHLRSSKLEAFARCAILRTAQWALDGRKNLPTLEEFRICLAKFAFEMIAGARDLREKVDALVDDKYPSIQCLNRSTHGLETEPLLENTPRPRLVITSPPYPGIHVLYHRWQVDGRKEAPAPFWIANKLDGDGAAYYTMGDRKAHELNTYFDNLRTALRSIAGVCTAETTIIQMVAFSEPSWQLPRYLSVADDAGMREQLLPELRGVGDGRLWRTVPNRKWYAAQRGETHGSQEVVLFHRRTN